MNTSTEIVGTCWYCGTSLSQSDYRREASCLACGKPTRVCRNCRHYTGPHPLDPVTTDQAVRIFLFFKIIY